jgi:hypothetical protein
MHIKQRASHRYHYSDEYTRVGGCATRRDGTDVADTALVGGCEHGATDRKQMPHSGSHEVVNLAKT